MSEQAEISTNKIIDALRANDEKAKKLTILQIGLFIVGIVSLLTAIISKVVGGHSSLIISFGVISTLFFIGNTIVGKKVELILETLNRFDNLIDKKIEEKQMIDAVRMVKNFVIQICEMSKREEIKWSEVANLKKISNYMTFFENGQRHYLILAEMTDSEKVDYRAHTTLLFLINDINILKMMSQSSNRKTSADTIEQVLDYRTRIILNACYLEHYLDAAEKHIALDESSINIENIQKIYQDVHDAYFKHIVYLSRENKYFKKKIKEQIVAGKVNDIPPLLMVIGTIINDQTKQLNNVYMTDEMHEQALNWMASMQTQAVANR